jgi:hypothetical protein
MVPLLPFEAASTRARLGETASASPDADGAVAFGSERQHG